MIAWIFAVLAIIFVFIGYNAIADGSLSLLSNAETSKVLKTSNNVIEDISAKMKQETDLIFNKVMQKTKLIFNKVIQKIVDDFMESTLPANGNKYIQFSDFSS